MILPFFMKFIYDNSKIEHECKRSKGAGAMLLPHLSRKKRYKNFFDLFPSVASELN
jgi:hypothetical protein